MRYLTTVLISAVLVVTVLRADDRDALKTELGQIYEATKTGIDELRIVNAGTILVIQKDGVTGNPSSEMTEAMTVVQDGEIGQKKGFLAAMSAKKSTRTFALGERVYLKYFTLAPESITAYVTSVDTHDFNVKGSTKQVRFNGEVRFMFPAEVMESPTGQNIKKLIDPVLAIEQDLAAAEPPTVEIGQTPEQIEAILGKPVRIVKAADRLMWTYSDLKVTFVDGKVVDIQ